MLLIRFTEHYYHDFSGESSEVFIKNPGNQTTRYGEIAEFRCLVASYQNYSMQIFVGDSKLFFDRGKICHPIMEEYKIDPREIGASYECHNSTNNASCLEGVGIFWMVVNNRTLQMVDYVWCKAILSPSKMSDSDLAYIDVIFQECSSTTGTAPRHSQNISVQSTSTKFNTNSGVLLSHYNTKHAHFFFLLSFSTSVYCALFVTV